MDSKTAPRTSNQVIIPEKLAGLRAAQERSMALKAARDARGQRFHRRMVWMGVASAALGLVCLLLIGTSLSAGFPLEHGSRALLNGLTPAVFVFGILALVGLRWPNPVPAAVRTRPNLLEEQPEPKRSRNQAWNRD
jgi:hypothetical protein